MNSYQKTILQLSEMKSRYDSGFSSSDRQILESLHRNIIGKGITNKGCSDCYRDAYVFIINHLKKTKTMPSKPNYILKAGAIIHPAGTSKFYGNPLLDDIAEDHLSKFPKDIIKFAYFPDDWEDRVAAFIVRKKAAEAEKEKQAHNVTDPTAPNEATDALNAELTKIKEALEVAESDKAEAEEHIAKLESAKAELVSIVNELRSTIAKSQEKAEEISDEESEEAVQLRMELETAKAELESAKEDNDKLKTENRALKAANTRLKNNGAKDTE